MLSLMRLNFLSPERYIEPLACAHPPRVHDGAETPSTIVEIRKLRHGEARQAFAGLFGEKVWRLGI